MEQKLALSETLVRALKGLLPAVGIVSMRLQDVEKVTSCNATMIE